MTVVVSGNKNSAFDIQWMLSSSYDNTISLRQYTQVELDVLWDQQFQHPMKTAENKGVQDDLLRMSLSAALMIDCSLSIT